MRRRIRLAPGIRDFKVKPGCGDAVAEGEIAVERQFCLLRQDSAGRIPDLDEP